MVEKLRIAVVVKAISCQTSKGTIIFGREGQDYFYDDIELTKNNRVFSESRIFTTVIDTATAKGDATLGAFLCMVKYYRVVSDRGRGLNWSECKNMDDPAFKALQSLYENGPDDKVAVICECQTKYISRESAIALGLLKGE